MWRYSPTVPNDELWHSNAGSHWYQHKTGEWDPRAAYARGKSDPNAKLRQNKVEAVSRLRNSLKQMHYKEFDKLMSPEQVAKQKRGSCHDQVMYEVDQLKKAGLSPKVKFLIETDDSGQGHDTHTFAYYESDGRVWWLENAWQDQQGLRSYDNATSMMQDVWKRWNNKADFPNHLSGNIDPDRMKPGMDLSDLIDLTELDD